MNTPRTPKKPHIPVRLTRAQRLANQKRQQQYANHTKLSTPSGPSIDALETQSVTSVSSTATARTTRSHIPRISRSSRPSKVISSSTKPARPPAPVPSNPSNPSRLPSSRVSTMIHELTMLFSSAHYYKVANEYIKLDSQKTWSAKTLVSIPLPEEENREDWIARHKATYPLTMADMIARGAFRKEIPSEFPSVEVFRQSYMDEHATYAHHRRPLWEACGSAFPITQYPRIQWNTIKLQYDKARTKKAIQACIHGDPAWYLCFWQYRGSELKQFGYSRPSASSTRSTPSI